ncbi:MAG: aminotransferase class V-fold PLP-dependent enzyme [Chloroflexota bacterium]
METYKIPMVPGPVSVPDETLHVYLTNFGSGDLEPEFLSLYNQVEAKLQTIFATKSKVVIQSGEAMVVLWGVLKSCLKPGDRVLAIATGLFGHAIARIATTVGADVQTVVLDDNQTLADFDAVEEAIQQFRPKMITVVHCETPSGTLNPLNQLGALKKAYDVPLLFVDAVASVGGTPVLTDQWHIDLCLTGSQKCLAMPPSLGILTVNDQAWHIINEVDYKGYDALKPFQTAQADHFFPYTPNWHATAALNVAADRILNEGLDACYSRHHSVAAYCRDQLVDIGYELFPADEAITSPTVTAIKVPSHIPWPTFDRLLRDQGLVVGGNYGPLAQKVFRLGHMGTQADMGLMKQALEVLATVI